VIRTGSPSAACCDRRSWPSRLINFEARPRPSAIVLLHFPLVVVSAHLQIGGVTLLEEVVPSGLPRVRLDPAHHTGCRDPVGCIGGGAIGLLRSICGEGIVGMSVYVTHQDRS